MNFNTHSEIEGCHSFLSPSKYHWIDYDEDKLRESFSNHCAAQEGSELHDLARRLIEHHIKLPNTKETMNMYVNDAIKYGMKPEQPLKYSDLCFGHADAISFKRNLLRIHDLKTGVIPGHIEQLIIYAALFCLEYDYRPDEIKIQLRIYQSDDVICYEPDPDEVVDIMQTIIVDDEILNGMLSEEI